MSRSSIFRNRADDLLLHVRLRLFVRRVAARRDDDNGHELVNKGKRPVFHLGSRVALSVDVGDLFELQRALECDRKVVTTSEIEKVAGIPCCDRNL